MKNLTNTLVLVTLAWLFFPTCFCLGGELESESNNAVLEIPRYTVEYPILFTGEKLAYDISWKGLKAAKAEIQTAFEDTDGGLYCIRSASSTIGFARMLWRMDDRAEVYTGSRDFRPREYSLYVREVFANLDINVTFNSDQTVARAVRTSRDKRKHKGFICHHAYDPGSAAFLIRSLDWTPGQTRWFEIVDGNERQLLIVEAISEEDVIVPAGSFSTIKLCPIIIKLPRRTEKEDSRLLEKIDRRENDTEVADEVFVWISREGRRPIVRTRAKAFIGFIELELVDIEG